MSRHPKLDDTQPVADPAAEPGRGDGAAPSDPSRGPSGTLRGGTAVPREVDVDALALELKAEALDLNDVFEARATRGPAPDRLRSEGENARRAAVVQVAGKRRSTSPKHPQEGKVVLAGRKVSGERGDESEGDVLVALPPARPEDPTAVSIASVGGPGDGPGHRDEPSSQRGRWLVLALLLCLGAVAVTAVVGLGPGQRETPAAEGGADEEAAADDPEAKTEASSPPAPRQVRSAEAEDAPPEDGQPEAHEPDRVPPPGPEAAPPQAEPRPSTHEPPVPSSIPDIYGPLYPKNKR